MRAFTILLAAVALTFPGVRADAEVASSPGFVLEQGSVTGGGGQASSENFATVATIALPAWGSIPW